jgi:hypothetical protein
VANKAKASQSDAIAIARIRHRTYGLLIDRGFLAFRTLVKSGVAAFGAWETHEMVKALARGRVDWNLVLRAVLSGRLSTGIMLCVTVAALGVAWFQTQLRRRLSAERAPYIQKLEQKVDPNRSSSRLPASGKTRKEDQE